MRRFSPRRCERWCGGRSLTDTILDVSEREFMTWLRRAERWFHPKELLHFTPPGFALALWRLANQPNTGDSGNNGLVDFDPEYIRFFCDTFRTVGEKYFRWRVSGIDNVPATG